MANRQGSRTWAHPSHPVHCASAAHPRYFGSRTLGPRKHKQVKANSPGKTNILHIYIYIYIIFVHVIFVGWFHLLGFCVSQIFRSNKSVLNHLHEKGLIIPKNLNTSTESYHSGKSLTIPDKVLTFRTRKHNTSKKSEHSEHKFQHSENLNIPEKYKPSEKVSTFRKSLNNQRKVLTFQRSHNIPKKVLTIRRKS